MTNQHKTTEASKNSRRTQEKHPRTVQNSGSTHEES